MLKEYDCWLQKRKIGLTIKIPDAVYVQGDSEIITQAAKEYVNGIQRLANVTPKIETKKTANSSLPKAWLGLISDMEKQALFSNLAAGAEGFVIKIADNNIYIAGKDDAGLLYAVFRFLSLLACGKIKDNFEISETPASSLRIINHWDNLDGTIERGYAGNSLFFKNEKIVYDSQRIEDYARLLASIGINRISLNNVNVRNRAKLLITEVYLEQLAELAAIFRRFAIRLFISVNFASPRDPGVLKTADPLDADVIKWWKECASVVYKYIPDLAGFIVKADSEGESGPFQYDRTHAHGANMLASAVKPYGGEIIWRCFVYNCQQDWRDKKADRAKAAYENFKPLDGKFDDNVILQIKFGPYDFQVREPVSPLFGALKKTRHIMELQITQEYTGHQIDLCYLPFMWEDIMNFDTGEKSIKDLIKGFAAVVNTGLDNNWTGHTLAQANLYGYGRIIWNPSLDAKEIAHEWCALSFGQNETAEKISSILLKSYPAYEKYTSPFGICFMVTPGLHYGPNIEGYEYSRWGTYHRANVKEIGIDRNETGFVNQYAKKNADIFSDPKKCPQNLLLFFHRLPYDFIMKNGETLLQNIYDTHFEGYDEVLEMLEQWKRLKKNLDNAVYESVLSRFERQLLNAREWRDQINTYFFRKTGIGDSKGRLIYD
ncbi:MAG: alpha-glucuronidase [Treponema sp.]|nr:alpha-glucuronidase [Treponema sp.]